MGRSTSSTLPASGRTSTLCGREPRWGRYLDRLASFSRLIVFDMRGVGLSDRRREPPLLETVGAVLLILGLGTRILALGFAIDMLMAIVLGKRGMAKKRFMEPDGTGWEFEFALMVAALALVFTGAGSIALDRIM